MKGRAKNPLDSRRGHCVATAADRVNWLLRNRHQWSGWCHGDARSRRLVEAMRSRGLFAPTTYWRHVRIDDLVRLAKAQPGPVPSSAAIDDLRAGVVRAARARTRYLKLRRAERAARVERLYNEHRTRRRAA